MYANRIISLYTKLSCPMRRLTSLQANISLLQQKSTKEDLIISTKSRLYDILRGVAIHSLSAYLLSV